MGKGQSARKRQRGRKREWKTGQTEVRKEQGCPRWFTVLGNVTLLLPFSGLLRSVIACSMCLWDDASFDHFWLWTGG